MKNATARVFVFILGLTLLLYASSPALTAEENERVGVLKQKISEAKNSAELYPYLEELKGIYFKDNAFSDFIAVLQSLGVRGGEMELIAAYYTALTRYRQLRYLEESQKWEEYFSSDNTYRSEVTESLAKVIAATTTNEPLHLYGRMLLWRFYRDQQDPAADAQLSDLMDEFTQYSEGGAADTAVIKNAAEVLSSYNDKIKSRQLYKLYVARLVEVTKNNAELKSAAAVFYNEGNLELAEAIYDAYIARITAAQGKAAITELIEIARQFSYRDRGPNDPAYAEEIFAKIEELGGREAFSEELMYLRAFNLEKAKEYPLSKDRYVNLIELFPGSARRDEAEFKIGIIYTYVLRDLINGRSYFTALSQKKDISPQIISSLYQLGLLAQWENKNEQARQYYLALKEKAGEAFLETVALTDERMRELDEGRPIEYNLKTFIDLSLRPENANFDRTKIELRSHPYRNKKDEEVNINSSYYYGETGCMQPELRYLWSGHLGVLRPLSKEDSQSVNRWALTTPDTDQAGFPTTYIHRGTKEINLVVVSPTGVVDRNIDMVDVYDPPENP